MMSCMAALYSVLSMHARHFVETSCGPLVLHQSLASCLFALSPEFVHKSGDLPRHPTASENGRRKARFCGRTASGDLVRKVVGEKSLQKRCRALGGGLTFHKELDAHARLRLLDHPGDVVAERQAIDAKRARLHGTDDILRFPLENV